MNKIKLPDKPISAEELASQINANLDKDNIRKIRQWKYIIDGIKRVFRHYTDGSEERSFTE